VIVFEQVEGLQLRWRWHLQSPAPEQFASRIGDLLGHDAFDGKHGRSRSEDRRHLLRHEAAEARYGLRYALGIGACATHVIDFCQKKLSNPDYLSPTTMLKQFRAVLHFAGVFGADTYFIGLLDIGL
jgi:hypothetical protein